MTEALRGGGAAGDDPWLTVAQVAADLDIHPATVRVWIKAGRLAAVRAGRTWRVRQSELDRALLADASSALVQDPARFATDAPVMTGPTSAPRQIADHILTIDPADGGSS